MRDPKRIPPMMKEMGYLWKKHFPDWRFGQFFINFMYWLGTDPFFLEDDEFMLKLKKFCEDDPT